MDRKSSGPRPSNVRVRVGTTDIHFSGRNALVIEIGDNGVSVEVSPPVVMAEAPSTKRSELDLSDLSFNFSS
jgi:hypothetical protein